jgi:nucleoside-diphosphate-sugar epimerase
MTILIVGANGATGLLLVEQLLTRGADVKVIVRSPEKLPIHIRNNERLSLVHASVLDLSDDELIHHVMGCDAVASCLGHNMTFKGIYGQPRMLVTEATRRLCDAIKSNKPDKAVRFILMNSAGNSNRGIPEQVSLAQMCVIWLLRLLVPPHVDNEMAADYLRTEASQNHESIEWAVVRPDNLTNESDVTKYEIHPSPTRSAIFDSGTTSRVNVSHFMADLATSDEVWNKWKGQMPVIYNKTLS